MKIIELKVPIFLTIVIFESNLINSEGVLADGVPPV